MAIFNSHVKLPKGISFGTHKLQKTSASRTTCGWPTGTSVPAPNQHNRQQDQPSKRPRQYLAQKKQGSWLVVHTFQKMLNISSQSYQKAWHIEVRKKKFQGLLKSLWLHAQQLKIEIDFAQDGRTQTHEKNIHTETASMFQIYAPNIPQMLDCPVRDKITIVHKSRETNKVRTKLLVR